MTTTTPALQWSVSEPPVEVRTGEQLDQLLDRIVAKCQPDHPISVILQAHGYDAHILLGQSESFVYLDEVAASRHFVTVGDSRADGVIGFHLFGQHHTEFERRYLIPAVAARRVLREFLETGLRSTAVQWEEGSY